MMKFSSLQETDLMEITETQLNEMLKNVFGQTEESEDSGAEEVATDETSKIENEFVSEPYIFTEEEEKKFSEHPNFKSGMEEAANLAGFYSALVASGIRISVAEELMVLKYSSEKQEKIVTIAGEIQKKVAKEKSALLMEHTS